MYLCKFNTFCWFIYAKIKLVAQINVQNKMIFAFYDVQNA